MILASGAALSACAPKPNRRAAKRGLLDVRRLDGEFPVLRARAAPGRFNLGVLSLSGDHVWSSDSEGRYPLADLAMLPIAAAALAEVDAGRLKLNEPIAIRDVDLSPPPSAIDAAFQGPTTLPAVDLIALAIQRGDNTAADVLMSHIGGPGAVNGWLQARGIDGLHVDRFAREVAMDMAGMPSFRSQWRTPEAFDGARALTAPAAREAAIQSYLRDPRDTTTIPAALSFLNRLSDGRLLSSISAHFLLGLMTRASTPSDGLAAALPTGAVLARKTGNSATDLGLTPAANEIGLVTLEDGHVLAITAFLTGSTATLAERAALIADAGSLFSAPSVRSPFVFSPNAL